MIFNDTNYGRFVMDERVDRSSPLMNRERQRGGRRSSLGRKSETAERR